jgi:hypothetical protein
MQSWPIYGFGHLQAQANAGEIGPFGGGQNPDRGLELDYRGYMFYVYIL